jgi:prolyl oligopeptidase
LGKWAALLQIAALVGLIVLLLEPSTTTPVTKALVPHSTPAAPIQPAAPPPTMPTLPLKYPATRTVDASDTYFGVKVADPYRWLEDGKSPEVQAWLQDENKLTRSYLDALPGRAALKKRYSQLLRIDSISAPGRAGDRYFYSKHKAEQALREGCRHGPGFAGRGDCGREVRGSVVAAG